MPVLICRRCGRTTNTAVCDWLDEEVEGKAKRCFALFDEDTKKWVKGCAYDEANFYEKMGADKVIRYTFNWKED